MTVRPKRCDLYPQV